MSPQSTESILIIEDEELFGEELMRHFQRSGWDVKWVRTLDEARREIILNSSDPSIVLADMKLPDGNSLDLFEETHNVVRTCEWIILTGYGGVPDSVRAMRLGAFDFLTKPCDFNQMDLVIASALRSTRAQRRVREESDAKRQEFMVECFIGSSSKANSLRYLLRRFSSVPLSSVIISGESGTGKGLVARILHHASRRSDSRIVEVNCAAIPEALLEAELFGHEAGAFTGAKGRRRGLFEQADGGTLFLDEIGEIPIGLQAKLLRAIEDKSFRRIGGEKEIKVDFQLLAATNRNLEAQVKDGGFRKDLFHRLNVINIEVPSLCDRLEDIYELVPKFIKEFNLISGKCVTKIPNKVWEIMMAYSWPGNVRELRNVIERCVLLSDSEVFPYQWLSLGQTTSTPNSEIPTDEKSMVVINLDGTESLECMEKRICEAAMRLADNNLSAAARVLRISRQTMRYRVKKHNIT